MKLANWSWSAVTALVWDIQTEMRRTFPHMGEREWETLARLYSPAVTEQVIRDEAEMFGRMMADIREISQRYSELSGHADHDYEDTAARRAEIFAGAFGAANGGGAKVTYGPLASVRAQWIYTLAVGIRDAEKRQRFMASFFPTREQLGNNLTAGDLKRWQNLELQCGMGIFVAIVHARAVCPQLTGDEFSAWLLKKYGIPLEDGEVEIYACHWCGSEPCVCGGRKAGKRKVTLETAYKHLHRGPRDTQRCMRMAYAYGNEARGGVAYGSLRSLLEQVAEGGTALQLERVAGSADALKRVFGPTLLPGQPHWAETLGRAEMTPEKRREKLLSELADAVHWQWLAMPMLDHCEGLAAAIRHVAEALGIELELPALPPIF